MKVLLVEDSLTEQLVITSYLKSMNHEVTTATTGPQALQLVATIKPDVILLDVIMPEMDGYLVAQKVREIYQDWIPIIFLSAMDDPEDIQAGIDAGGDDYLAKPANQTILFAKMKAMERIAHMRAQLVETQSKLEEANRNLALQASRDGLTGIANRREFDKQLQREYARCQRENVTMGLLICDIDYFKAYNDSYGHLAGDDCIKMIAGLLERNQIRSSDLVARYGGEEFAILLPHTNKQGIITLANRLLQKINEANIEHQFSDAAPHVTLSIGGSCSDRLNDLTPHELIDQADQALYQAKHEGRNNFKLYDSDSEC